MRRMSSTRCAAYSGDLPVVSTSLGVGSGWSALLQVHAALGAPPAPSKCLGPGHYRPFLGTGLRLAAVASGSTVRLEPRQTSRQAFALSSTTSCTCSLSASALPSSCRHRQARPQALRRRAIREFLHQRLAVHVAIAACADSVDQWEHALKLIDDTQARCHQAPLQHAG